MSLHENLDRILIEKDRIEARVKELARQLEQDYKGEKPILVGVMKGAVIFYSDLAREMGIPVTMDFIAISSYGRSTKSSGVVRILKDLDREITGEHVIIVEDIVDTGLTLHYLMDILESREPKSLRVCSLLDKPERRKVDFQPDYVGFEIPDEFVVGYGLDFADDYRNLPEIWVLKQ